MQGGKIFEKSGFGEGKSKNQQNVLQLERQKGSFLEGPRWVNKVGRDGQIQREGQVTRVHEKQRRIQRKK